MKSRIDGLEISLFGSLVKYSGVFTSFDRYENVCK